MCPVTLKMQAESCMGRRVQIDKYKATVRYSGPLEGQEGLWIGLEWDDASRGRHNGSVDGRHYFQCEQEGGAGSFVRASKFQPAADFGQTLPEALTLRCDGIVYTAAKQVIGSLWCCAVMTPLLSRCQVCKMSAPDSRVFDQVPGIAD